MVSIQVRNEVVERSGGLCEGTERIPGYSKDTPCLSGIMLEIHHIIPKRMGGRKGPVAKALDMAWNLMLVCRACHSRCQGTYKLTIADKELIRQHSEDI